MIENLLPTFQLGPSAGPGAALIRKALKRRSEREFGVTDRGKAAVRGEK